MEDTFKLVVSRGYCQLVHKSPGWKSGRRVGDPRWYQGLDDEPGEPEPPDGPWDVDDPEPWAWEPPEEPEEPEIPWWAYKHVPERLRPLAERLREQGALGYARGDEGQSARSRNNMRRTFASLPWELLGPWPAMVSLTYPGDWGCWVPNGRVLEDHRKAFERRWVRRWKEPLVGVWAKEFQESGSPHLHLYIGLPDAMSAEDFEGLRQRTLLRHRLEWQYGRYDGRRRLPAIGREYGGEFAMWIRTAWSEIVGTQGKHQKHHARGVDVAVMFWNDEVAGTVDRTAVAKYLAREAAKFRQKKPPEGFVGVGRYYGMWGGKVGFKPLTDVTELDPMVWYEMERRLSRWIDWKLRALRRGQPRSDRFFARRPGDGLTAFDIRPEQAQRVLAWSDKAADRKRQRALARQGSGGGAPGEITWRIGA